MPRSRELFEALVVEEYWWGRPSERDGWLDGWRRDSLIDESAQLLPRRVFLTDANHGHQVHLLVCIQLLLEHLLILGALRLFQLLHLLLH